MTKSTSSISRKVKASSHLPNAEQAQHLEDAS